MNRRSFMKLSGAVSVGVAVPISAATCPEKQKQYFMFKGKKCEYDPNIENLGMDLMKPEIFVADAEPESEE